jgi:hypothetical protein
VPRVRRRAERTYPGRHHGTGHAAAMTSPRRAVAAARVVPAGTS